MKVSELYEPFIERDLAAIPAACRAFRAEHSSDDLFLAVARFAVLAFAPSQHAKHALLCCLAAHDLRDDLGDRFDDALIECAIYTAASRQPWSEPPFLDLPPIDDEQRGDVDEFLAAIETGDRLRGERWLAKRFRDDDFARDLFNVAASDFEDLGHKLIITNAAWRLANILGEKGRYAALRVGVWECVAYKGPRYEEEGVALDVETLLARLVDDTVCEEGSMVSAHAVFLLDAALETGDEQVIRRVRDYLTNITNELHPQCDLGAASDEIPIYRFARDCGASFKARAVAKRRKLDRRFVAAADWNREHGTSLEDFSFA
ncbi:MAG: hypothetical protein JWO97_3237 [Acidobacteria bacterium]|nr:hypothetical protein [Acidobacteriota bacterium]